MDIYYQARNKRLFIESVPVAALDEAYFEEPYCDTVLRCFEEEDWEEKEGGRWIYDPVPPVEERSSEAHHIWIRRICNVLNDNICSNRVHFEYCDQSSKIYLRGVNG